MMPPSEVPCPPINLVAECTTMSAPVFNGTDQERRSESVVHDEWDLMTVGNFCHGFQIRDVRIGVAQRFNKQGFGFLADGLLKV
mgnify:CR=1 FL=1